MQTPRDAWADELQAAIGAGYVLDGEIGRGGMATVYRARDVAGARDVAIKVLHQAFGVGVETERFLREIELASRLTHPRILPLLNSGRVAEVPFFVMPFVDGETLTQRLQRDGALTVADSVAITGDMLDALGYAHQLGVIHRDIKPDNIMLSDGHALVTDFGIGKALNGDQVALTQTGMALGTPAYMSLEQAAGDPDLDLRSDLYSTALVLYEMLSGATPFTGNTPQAVIAARFVQKVRPLAGTIPGIGPALDAVLLRALAQRRDDRFASALEFSDALRAAIG